MANRMTAAKAGDTVHIHYTGTLADGEVFDSSQGREPLESVVGSGMIIPGLDAAIPGMSEGDKKVVEVPVEQAYGPVNKDARQAIPLSDFPADIPLGVGTRLQMQSPQGQPIAVTIAEVNDAEVTLDANHPLAGKDLTFAIEMTAIGTA